MELNYIEIEGEIRVSKRQKISGILIWAKNVRIQYFFN